jgi:hypothetical protein
MNDVSQAARMLGQRSVEARIHKWGKREFVRNMREWGKLGGRPPKKKLKSGKNHSDRAGTHEKATLGKRVAEGRQAERR